MAPATMRDDERNRRAGQKEPSWEVERWDARA